MPTQKERNAETRRRLLAAARETFAESGYANAAVADIVKRAGRAHGSFYLHFGNKEDVLKALLEEAMAELALEGRTMWQWDDPGTSVHKTVLRYIEEFGENRDLWLLLDQRSSLESAFKKISDEWFQHLVSGIVRGMVSSETPGLMRGLDPEILAQVFAAMLSDSTRAMYLEDPSWTAEELAAEISGLWSRTLGYDDASVVRARSRGN